MRKLVAIGLLIFVGYLIISLSRSVWNLWEKQEEVYKAHIRVEKLKSDNTKLKSELSYVQTDAFIEKEARDKLNYVKPDETAVIIPQAVLQAATASASPTPPPPNWEQWLRLFF